MSAIEITALDTLFFRDGKPFSMGNETWAEGVFPPPPSVLYGAIRTSYLVLNGIALADIDSEKDPSKKLRIHSVYLNIDEINIFPIPLDLVGDEKNVFPLGVKKNEDYTNLPNRKEFLFTDTGEYDTPEQSYINEEDLQSYLTKPQEKYTHRKLTEHLHVEAKVGIGRSASNTSEEGKLYRVNMLRPEKLSIIVEYEGIELPKTGFLKLGAEGKIASFKNYKTPFQKKSISLKKNDQFKLYLQTPAILENGSFPYWLDISSLIGTIDGVTLQLTNAAIGKPISIGGFDMKEKKPKEMNRAVSSGSVYYLKILDGSEDNIHLLFNNPNFLRSKGSNEGFGSFQIGVYNL